MWRKEVDKCVLVPQSVRSLPPRSQEVGETNLKFGQNVEIVDTIKEQ